MSQWPEEFARIKDAPGILSKDVVEDGSDANVDSPSETEADDVQTSSDEDEGDLPATPVDQPLLTNGDLLGEKRMF